jgi:demethylmenaquinone methyltransferase / 2-methoxy-6-polyprenyl-1,4-benzoquinol methylase
VLCGDTLGRAFEVRGERRHAARIEGVSGRTRHARALFAPLGSSYDRVGAALSLGQDPLWRRFLVSRLPRGGHVLDVATGTGLVAAELLRRGFTVTGLDQSPEMLAVARERFSERVQLVEASAAAALPFPDAAFDHLTVTYLLRYVDDPPATVAELARVVRPGGVVASLEFGVPGALARPLWNLYVGLGLPLAGLVLQDGWREVGGFLGPSIRDFWQRNPLERQLAWWEDAGLRGVEVRRLSLGGGVVMWGTRT